MSYTLIEQSIERGQPVELYEFIAPNRSYYYTSFVEDFTFEGNTYIAVPIQRQSITGGSDHEDTGETRIQMAFDLEVVRDFAYSIAPFTIELVIHRTHVGIDEVITYWRGLIDSFNVRGREATARVPSILSGELVSSIPNVYYQSQCNHVLFDARCRAGQPAFTINTTVDNIVAGLNLTLNSVGGNINDYFKGGQITHTETGDRRLIVSQTDNGIRINFPFRTINQDDSVTIIAGCDHTARTCVDKFDNIVNFGGYNLIPNLNPFAGELS